MRLALVFPQSIWDLFVRCIASQHSCIASQHSCIVDKLTEEFIVEMAINPEVPCFVFHVDC